MPIPPYRAISFQIFILCSIAVLCTLFALVLTKRPLEQISSIQTPDTTHVHQVYKGNPLTTEFISTAQGLSKIAIAIRPTTTIPNIRVVELSSKQEIPSSVTVTPSALEISFPVQRQSYQQKFAVHIETPTTPKQQALIVPYESDPTKYPTSLVWQGGTQKQGSIGITQYEQPTRAVLFSRWLALPHQRPLWIGLGFLIVGITIRKRITVPLDTLPSMPRIHWIWFVGIMSALVLLYYPATSLFFYSDDVPILARTATMWQQNPLLLLTPHQYQETDIRAAFGFDFWRPVSFAIYPLLLHLFLPASAYLYHLANILLFAIIGCLLFVIANRILQSRTASLLAVTLWASSSTKLGVVYWWSSVQDILASLFAMAAIALYLSWRSNTKRIYLYLAVASYLLGVFSKEYVIVTPVAIIGLEILLAAQHNASFSWKKIAYYISPFIIASSVFLIGNTAVLGDPTLPPRKHTDQTYSLTFSPQAIVRNTIVYLGATAEAKQWPQTPLTNTLEQKITEIFRFDELKTSGPYYPGVVIGVGALILVAVLWKYTTVRSTALFGITWWILFMGPILLFANDWKLRWLMLATFGTGILVASLLERIPKKVPGIPFVLLLLSAGIFFYGYTNARSMELTRFYREQSEYTRNAYHQLLEQEKTTGEEQRIILVGIIPEQETSLNAYLFRVYAKNPQADIIYTESIPDMKRPGDIIINMTGIAPYYPESEK